MHHGMPYRAFGFCYVNDLVLAVLELMAGCGRVLYIGEVGSWCEKPRVPHVPYHLNCTK